MDDFQKYVARVVGHGPDGKSDEHYLLPFGPESAPRFRECVLDSKMFVAPARLQMFFSQKAWYIAEEGAENQIREYLASIEIARFPQKGDKWTNCGSNNQTVTFTCSLMTIDQYSSTMLLMNFGEGATNQLAKFKEEYALAHAECYSRLHMLEGRTAGIQATTEELKTSVGDLQQKQLDILRRQGAVNKSIEERLNELEKIEEKATEPPAKRQRFDKCANRHHEQVKARQWLNPGDVVLLKSHANQQYVVETWTGTHYTLCGKISDKLFQSNNRNMLWPCARCNVGTDVAA